MTSEPLPLRVVRLPEASRSDMRQDTYHRAGKAGKDITIFRREQQSKYREEQKLAKQLLKACPTDGRQHPWQRQKARLLGDSTLPYDLYWCPICKQFRLSAEDREELRADLKAELPIPRTGPQQLISHPQVETPEERLRKAWEQVHQT